MNAEIEAHLVAVRNAPPIPSGGTEQRRREQVEFPGHFLAHADATIRPVLESAAQTLQKHGYGATVERVEQRSGADPNTFPYVTLHFSPQRSSPADLGYIYTIAGASVSFICQRNDLCVEVVIAHPAGRGVERRVNFSTLPLEALTQECVGRIVTDAIMHIVRR
jgi:hypothetical protein